MIKRYCKRVVIVCLAFIIIACGKTDDYKNNDSKDIVDADKDSVNHSLTENLIQNQADESEMEELSIEDSVLVRVTEKNNIDADIYEGRYSDRVNFVIEVTNQTNKTIKGVQGKLKIDDLFGKNIMTSNCDFTGQIIQPGETVSYTEQGIEINEFIDSHVKLYNEKYADLNFTYEVENIVFADDNKDVSTTTKGAEEVVITCTDKKNYQRIIMQGDIAHMFSFTLW